MGKSPGTPRNREPYVLDLTIADLEGIVDALKRIQQAHVRFSGDLIAGYSPREHLVTIKWVSNQMDGDWPVITRIRRA